MTTGNTQPRGRLISHFSDRDREGQSAGWSSLWDSNESDLWDRGLPSPALIDFVEGRITDVLAQPSGAAYGGRKRRLRALVPGCGKGYDVLMLALHGFDAFGLEVSQTAVDVAKRYAKEQLTAPPEHYYGTSRIARTGSSTSGNTDVGAVNFVLGDFFKRDWEGLCQGEDGEERFDLIYDYTFLCALLPDMRKDWAQRMAELLSPDGILVCLEFPLYKDVEAIGPPWGLKGVYWNLLAKGGDGILKNESSGEGDDDTSELNGKFTRVMYYKPTRSYESGKGTDMISVWRRKKT